jgi:hypothetical protein
MALIASADVFIDDDTAVHVIVLEANGGSAVLSVEDTVHIYIRTPEAWERFRKGIDELERAWTGVMDRRVAAAFDAVEARITRDDAATKAVDRYPDVFAELEDAIRDGNDYEAVRAAVAIVDARDVEATSPEAVAEAFADREYHRLKEDVLGS